jgi:hypothetical protein
MFRTPPQPLADESAIDAMKVTPITRLQMLRWAGIFGQCANSATYVRIDRFQPLSPRRPGLRARDAVSSSSELGNA